MDRFLNIDWNPSLEDIIDNTYVDPERFEKESVMHKIMTGNFIDPFKYINFEYKEIKTDLMSDIESKPDVQCLDDSIETTKMKTKVEIEQANKFKHYVPGIVKPIFKFPKKSELNKEQQAMCLRVLLRFSESDRPKITPTEREELRNYMGLQKIISQEQSEFLKFAKSKWHERSFSVVCEDYINLRWKSKLQNIYNIPRYYAEVINVPFVANKNIEVKLISVCLEMGQLSKIVLPTFTRPYILRAKSEQLLKRFPPKNYICNESPVCFKLPVSEDPNCQKLAENNNVDLVISSSGLNCLVNNIGPNHSNSWILPVVIKRHNDKNVIYIDKAAPPNANTVPNKNNWVYKYILKYFLVRVKHLISKSTGAYSDNIFGDVNCEEFLRLEDKYENASSHIHSESHVNGLMKTESENTEDTLKEKVLKNYTNILEDVKLNCEGSSDTILNSNTSNSISDKVAANESSEMTMEGNVSYKLFTIGPHSLKQNQLMKDTIKEYKMLVRTKTDGFEILENNVQKLLLLAPKLEHQVDLGAEAVTLEESLKQWISLIFRPLTFLARVRISAKTSEILQVEHRTAMSISNEIKRLYNVNVEDSLTILHNVVQTFENLSTGRYIMRHTIRNGLFAAVYKEEESNGKNVFDIRTVYSEQFYSLHNPPWIPLDKIVPNPMLKCFERMPAMFYPINSKTLPTSTKSKNVKKSKTRILRRSLRNKQIIFDN